MRGLRALAALVAALPWVAASSLAPSWFREGVGVTFLPLCHHWVGRVLVVGGAPMCVCSRCAGVYAGLAAGFALSAPLATGTYRRLLAVAVALAAVDVVTQDLGVHAPWHPARLATGALLGWTMAAWMVRETLRARWSPRSPASPRCG